MGAPRPAGPHAIDGTELDAENTRRSSTPALKPSPAIPPRTRVCAEQGQSWWPGTLPGTPRPVAGTWGGGGAGTFGFADGGVVAAAALVVHAERVALALLHRVEALIAATLAGLCKGHRARKEHRGVKANVVTSRLRGPNMDTHPRGLRGRRSPLPPPMQPQSPICAGPRWGGFTQGSPAVTPFPHTSCTRGQRAGLGLTFSSTGRGEQGQRQDRQQQPHGGQPGAQPSCD